MPNNDLPIGRPPARLLLSIHDVGPRADSAVDRLISIVEAYAAPARFAMLVVPDHWGEAPIISGSRFATRLRDWSDAGVEIFLHGWFHRDRSTHRSTASRLKACYMTAGEGEFLGLGQAEASTRMRAGRNLLESIIGRPVTGFVAPAWLYGDGALAAAAECGFDMIEDHWRVWRPTTGAVLARGPVITWASRSAARRTSSLLVANLARACLPARGTMRLAVHPGDAQHPRLLASIDRTIAALVSRASVGRYADLLPSAHPRLGEQPFASLAA